MQDQNPFSETRKGLLVCLSFRSQGLFSFLLIALMLLIDICSCFSFSSFFFFFSFMFVLLRQINVSFNPRR